MKVVILCGGQGTRLREETEYRPKPLVDVGGRPILWHIMKLYAHYGFSDFVLCLGYRGNMIKEYFLNYQAMNNDFTLDLGAQKRVRYHQNHAERNFRVTLADTGSDAATGTRVKRIERYIDDESFMVTYGDGISDVDLRRLAAFHCSHHKLATVTTVRPFSRFGIIDVDKKNKVLRFAEKPQVDGWVNAGFFVFNKKIFRYLNEKDCVLEKEPIERLAKDGQLMAYRHEGYFLAMDTYREYRLLNEAWDLGRAPWKVWK